MIFITHAALLLKTVKPTWIDPLPYFLLHPEASELRGKAIPCRESLCL